MKRMPTARTGKINLTGKGDIGTLFPLFLSGTYDWRYIRELPGHESGKTTEIYTHITKKGWEKTKSPLDDLDF